MHQHGWPYQDPSTHKCTELGPTCCIRETVHGDDLHLAGFIIAHDLQDEDGPRCEGAVAVDPHFDPERAVWTMTGSLEAGNLTLSPSVACSIHPYFHAFVQNGRWTG